MTKLLKDMNGEELAALLTETADRVQETIRANREVVRKLREAAEELERKRRNA